MLTRLLTLLTTRFGWVAVVVVVAAAAAVPAVSLAGHVGPVRSSSAASGSRAGNVDEHARIVLHINKAGDDVIVALYDNEAGCDASIDQLAGQSRLPAGETAADLQRGKDQFHASVVPFVDQLLADEREVDDMRVLTSAIEQTYLIRIGEIRLTALGGNGQNGVLYNVCEAILIDIQQVITVAPAGSRGDDVKPAGY